MFEQLIIKMIQNGSLNELNFQIRTQVPNVKRILKESQQIIWENDSNHSHNHEAQSQNLHNRDADFTLEYKKKLVKLMVMVKFQRFGFQKNELLPMIQYYLDKINHLEKVNNRHLTEQADKIFLKVFSQLIGQSWVSIRRPNDPENVLEEQRQDQMSQQIPNQRRVLEHESILRVRPQQQNSILCNICYTVSNNYCGQTCGHSFCIECMKGYLQQNLRSDNYIVKCPEYECSELVSLNTVKQMLSPKQYQRFIFFRQKNQKQMNPENKFCSMYFIGNQGRIVEKLICPKCKSEYCEICLQKYHHDQPCEMALGNELKHAFKDFQIKKCPGCKSPIQKSDGCNHMTCKKCKYEFCWLCQKKYSKHHYKYYNCFGCPGMQYQSEDEIIVQRLKQICLYMVLPILLAFLLFCYIAGLPLFIVAKFIERPCYWNREGHQMFEYNAALKLCCQKQTILFYIVVWLFFQPRALLYALFIAPVKLTLFFCGEIASVLE